MIREKIFFLTNDLLIYFVFKIQNSMFSLPTLYESRDLEELVGRIWRKKYIPR